MFTCGNLCIVSPAVIQSFYYYLLDSSGVVLKSLLFLQIGGFYFLLPVLNTSALLSILFNFLTCCLYFALLNLPHNFYRCHFYLIFFIYFRLCTNFYLSLLNSTSFASQFSQHFTLNGDLHLYICPGIRLATGSRNNRNNIRVLIFPLIC